MKDPIRGEIHVSPVAPRDVDPCTLGAHVWAWAYLARGGTAQLCRRCGKARR